MNRIKWAIVSTGYIANHFVQGLLLVPDAERCAVVSRNEETAESFARKYDFASSYSDFDQMLKVEKPDIVYIAVPNDCHYSYIMRALEAGVHVLCEKPMVDNLEQLHRVIQKAEERQCFLMEGMWTRCFPAVRQARTWIENGKIGHVSSVRASLDIKPDPADWQLWKAGIEHAGGALRDVGIYSLAMALIGFPEFPKKICSNMVMNEEVDIRCELFLTYANGGTSFLSGAFDRVSDHSAVFIGDNGRITIGPEFAHPSTAVMQFNDGSVEKFEQQFETKGFQFEIMRVQECLRNGLKECPDFSWHDSIQICTMIDQLRQEWQIVYRSDVAPDSGHGPD